MNVNDLQDLIKEYNSHKVEIFDHCADALISKLRNKLEEEFNSGRWQQMYGANQIGISISKMDFNF